MKNFLLTLSIYKPIRVLVYMLIFASFAQNAYSQAEVESWGNITGIRKSGQLFEFESSVKVTGANDKTISTAKERQKPHFKRDGDNQIITTSIDSLYLTETVTDKSAGNIHVNLQVSAHKDTAIKGVYFCLTLPAAYNTDGRFKLTGTKSALKDFTPFGKEYQETASGAEFNTPSRKLKIAFDENTAVMLKKGTGNTSNNWILYVTVKQGEVHKGDQMEKNYTISASGDIDKAAVTLAINTTQQGREFDGLGGNFRLQNAKNDPQVIDYSLKNLRLAYGRVELPWRNWQPNKDVDPTASADSGKLAAPVKNAMNMAKRLDSLGVPIILSAWFPPAWAAEGRLNARPTNGMRGNPLNKANMDAIYKSIADYILYLKNKMGVDIKLFSFNESDIGINVRVTPQEHDDFIKGCGAYFAAHGVTTKMLLGDNSDANTYAFIYPALNDPAAKQYIGAVSFHSWRGFETETLQKWYDAAQKIGLPLLVGEGSIDAAAYSYPDIFQEQTYALQEIGLYTRILAICQPLSILQWQLTSDYSPLIGGGIYGNTEPLHPGQRFNNLKQLSLTPKGLFAMPITSTTNNIACAALGDNSKNTYAVHLVNNGTTRKVTLTGLPAGVKQLKLYATNKQEYMKTDIVEVVNGQATFKLPSVTYATLISQ